MPKLAGPPSPLALARFLRGFTQAELAQRASRSEETVRRVEAGGTPHLRTAQALALALGVEVSTLFPSVKDETQPGRAGLVTTPAGGDGRCDAG